MKIGKFILKLASMLKWSHIPLAAICFSWALLRLLNPEAFAPLQPAAICAAILALIVAAIDIAASSIRAFCIPILHDVITSEDGTKGVKVHVFPDNK